jgi:hypothetical protein
VVEKNLTADNFPFSATFASRLLGANGTKIRSGGTGSHT